MLVARCLVFSLVSTPDVVVTSRFLQLFDEGSKGFVTEGELCRALFESFGIGDEEAQKMFREIPRKNPDLITYGV